MINTATKKTKWSFEKISLSFFTLAYGFMVLSFVFYFINKGALQKINKKEIQVNVVNLDADDSFIEESNIYTTLIAKYTSDANPNIKEEEIRKEILNMIDKKQNINYLLNINEKGVLNNYNVQIGVGDSVSFLNNSNIDLEIIGFGGWGTTLLKPGELYTQVFYPVKKYNFTVKPFNTKGEIEVTAPVDTSN